MFNPLADVFHWTTRKHGSMFSVLGSIYLGYNYFHDYPLFVPFFERQGPPMYSPLMDQNFLELIEEQLIAVSNQRKMPIGKAKFEVRFRDTIETSTMGSFHLNPTTIFRFPTRMVIDDVALIREHYPNLCTLIIGSKKAEKAAFSVDTAAQTDEFLAKFILSKNARKYAIAREISKADSTAELFLPVICAGICAVIALPLLIGLRQFTYPLAAFIMIEALTYSAAFAMWRPWIRHYEKVYDRIVFSIDESYINGCKEYLKNSMEIGKYFYQLGESKLFAENGDCLSHRVPYSKRLEIVESYRRDKRRIRRRALANR